MEDTTNLTPAQLRAAAFRLDAESDRNRAEANELRALAAEREAAPEPAAERTDAAGLARALGASTATVSRLTRDGMPCELVGARRRYCVAECRAWLTARGAVAAPKNHVRRVPVADDVDVSSVPGLRRVGAAR